MKDRSLFDLPCVLYPEYVCEASCPLSSVSHRKRLLDLAKQETPFNTDEEVLRRSSSVQDIYYQQLRDIMSVYCTGSL